MSVDQEQGIGRAPKTIRSFTMEHLKVDQAYLKRLLLVHWYGGEPLKDVAREFGRSPKMVGTTVARMLRTLEVRSPIDVLDVLRIDIAPLSQEKKERMDRELGIQLSTPRAEAP